MATVEKDFKVKKGLIVEGTTATVNNYDVLTKKTDDQNYIIGLIGGSSDSANTPNTVVKRDGSGNFAAGTITANLTGDVTGNADTATTLETARTISISGDAVGSASFDGSANANIAITIDSAFATDAEVATAAGNAISDAATYTNTAIGTEVTNRNSAIATAKSEAISAASDDATSKANAAQTAAASDATTKANAAQANAISTAAADATTKADAAQAAAESTASTALSAHESDTSTHGVTGDIVGTTDTQTLSNKTLGSDLAAGGYKVSGLLDPSANQDAATKAYVDGAVADLVNSAPAILDTLGELATAIGEDQNFVTTVTTSIGEKVAKAGDSMSGDLDFGGTNKVTSLSAPTSNGDATNKLYVDDAVSNAINTTTYTAGTNIDITGNVVSVTGLDSLDISDFNSAAVTANTGLWDTFGDASAAQTAAEGFATNADSALYTNVTLDIATAKGQAESTAQGYANTAESNANDFTTSSINLLSTTDIEEGANLYFEDSRAKTSAADLLVNASLTNITITGSGAGLTIQAENGVADSDTSDLLEDPSGTGTSGTWYFTNARAVSALEAVVPNFTEVDINSLATQVAATTGNIATASLNNVAYAFAKADYRSAKFLVKCAYGTHTELAEVLLTLDSTDNIAITEYAIVGTNGSSMTISAGINANNVELLVSTVNNNSTVTVVGTLLA